MENSKFGKLFCKGPEEKCFKALGGMPQLLSSAIKVATDNNMETNLYSCVPIKHESISDTDLVSTLVSDPGHGE